MQGEGKCILSASQATQEAYGKKRGGHSIFTFYLLEGLKPNEMAVDLNGNVTVDTLGRYVYDTIMSLPPDKRPNQKPVRKVEAGGTIILASYPQYNKTRQAAQPNRADLELEQPIKMTSSIFLEAEQRLSKGEYNKAINLYNKALNFGEKIKASSIVLEAHLGISTTGALRPSPAVLYEGLGNC